MRRASLLSVLLTWAPTACGSIAHDEPLPAPEPIPAAVQRAFEGSCMHEGCHDASAQTNGQAGGLSLDAADSPTIVGGPSSQSELPLVTIGSVNDSYMAIKLLPDDQLPAGAVRHEERMPLDGISLDDIARVNTIMDWIRGLDPAGTDGGMTTMTGTTGGGSGNPGDGSGTGPTGGSGDPTDSGPTTNSGGNPVDPACSVQEVTEGVVSDPLDKGEGAGQIPHPVGVVLEDRCGCHTLADRELNTKFPALRAPAGTLLLDYADATALGPSYEDAIFGAMSMPPGSCPSIPADDQAVLDKWFSDGLPDGATFEPP